MVVPAPCTLRDTWNLRGSSSALQTLLSPEAPAAARARAQGAACILPPLISADGARTSVARGLWEQLGHGAKTHGSCVSWARPCFPRDRSAALDSLHTAVPLL